MRLNLSAFRLVTFLVPAALAAPASAQWDFDPDWEAPVDYYQTADGLTGSALRDQIHLIIEKDYFSGPDLGSQTQHRLNDYADAGPALDVLDQSFARSGIFDIPFVNHVYDNDDVLLTDPTPRNREHVWSASRHNPGGRDNIGRDYADLHNLRWAYASTNSSKSNRNFGGSPVGGGNGEGISSPYWYPGEEHKGDTARINFYMDVRYDGNMGQDPNSGDLVLVNGNPSSSGSQQGDLAAMLEWHYADPVSNFELRRNDIIFERSYEDEFGAVITPNNWLSQGNRNFAVDRPELVHSIFVDQQNDTQISVGGAPNADGSSSVDVQLGRVMQGQSAGSLGTASMTINKTGNDGTYYSITASGGATAEEGGASVEGRYNAFAMNAPGSRNIDVGLSGGVDTSSTGLQGGSITINNLDVTTNGGAGVGANDGDDVINVGVAVLAQRTVVSNTADFGMVLRDAAVSAGATLTTSGSDNERTRVNVATTGANGPASVTGGSGTLFDDASDTGSRTVEATFNTAGAHSGSVGLGVSTAENGGAGLTGEGAYADVQVGYTATVLDHANGSFDATLDDNTLTLDFGTVYQTASVADQSFDIFNLTSTVGFTAGLDLDSITPGGDAAAFGASLAPLSALAAGASAGFTASVDTTNSGSFIATYTIATSDEDLPGAAAGDPLVLTITADVQSVVTGDMNLDGVADADDLSFFVLAVEDLATYTNTVGIDPLNVGDLDMDNDVDADDVRLAADTFEVVGGGSVNRKDNFIAVDEALDVLDDGLLNASDDNFFNTLLETSKDYAWGDARGDLAGPGAVAGADGVIDANDIDFLFAVIAAMETSGADAAATLLDTMAVDGDGLSGFTEADVLIALNLADAAPTPGPGFDAEAWYAQIYGPIPEPATGVLCLAMLALLAPRRAARSRGQ